MSTVKLKILFEQWFLSAFPDGDESLLLEFNPKDGYTKSDDVNAMWVGFCGAIRLNEE